MATPMMVKMRNLISRKIFLALRLHAGCNVNCSHVRSLSSLQIYVDQYGNPNEVVKCRTIELPSDLEPRQVLVKMMYAPVNPSDINMIEGTYFVQPPLPTVLGNEGVGRIVEVGEEVKGLSVGDWVIPREPAWGTWQTYQISHDENILKIPNDVCPISAATVSVNGCTAYRMLKDYVKLKPGDVILQNGANSGCGVSVIQLAKEWNIKTVNIVRDRQDFSALEKSLKAYGADYVVKEEFVRTSKMKELMNSIGKPKLAFNCIGGSSATELIRYLDQGGIMVTYGGMSRRPIVAPTGALVFKQVILCGYWNTDWNRRPENALERIRMLAELMKLMNEGKFSASPSEPFQLEEYKEAISHATEGFKGGKAIFQIDADQDNR